MVITLSFWKSLDYNKNKGLAFFDQHELRLLQAGYSATDSFCHVLFFRNILISFWRQILCSLKSAVKTSISFPSLVLAFRYGKAMQKEGSINCEGIGEFQGSLWERTGCSSPKKIDAMGFDVSIIVYADRKKREALQVLPHLPMMANPPWPILNRGKTWTEKGSTCYLSGIFSAKRKIDFRSKAVYIVISSLIILYSIRKMVNK